MSQRAETIVARLPRERTRVAGDLLALTKPRVVLMVLITTAVGYYVGLTGGPDYARLAALLLATLGIFELGVAPQRLGTPVRDAFVMAIAFGGASLVPLVPFLFGRALAALGLSLVLTLGALFVVGIVKARVVGVSAVRSGLEVAVLAAGSGALSFGLGRLASLVLGVDVR